MIQSLVEWDHSVQWAVAEFTSKVTITLKNTIISKKINSIYRIRPIIYRE